MTDRRGDAVRLADDRHDFVIEHLGLAFVHARTMMRRLAPGRFSTGDLKGIGHLALVDAAARWDEGRGFRFATYLRHYVRKYVVEAIYADAALHVGSSYLSDFPADGTPAQVAGRAARQAAARRGWRALSLDVPDPATGRSYAGAIPDRGEVEPAVGDDVDEIRARLGGIRPRDREVLLRYFGGRETLADVAASMGVSRQRASQIHRRGMARLRALYGVGVAPPPAGKRVS